MLNDIYIIIWNTKYVLYVHNTNMSFALYLCIIPILIERYRFYETICAITIIMYNMYNMRILHSIHGHVFCIGYPQ